MFHLRSARGRVDAGPRSRLASGLLPVCLLIVASACSGAPKQFRDSTGGIAESPRAAVLSSAQADTGCTSAFREVIHGYLGVLSGREIDEFILEGCGQRVTYAVIYPVGEEPRAVLIARVRVDTSGRRGSTADGGP